MSGVTEDTWLEMVFWIIGVFDNNSTRCRLRDGKFQGQPIVGLEHVQAHIKMSHQLMPSTIAMACICFYEKY